MKLDKKIRGRIIWSILITSLAAGFYFYLGRDNNGVETVKPGTAATQKDAGEEQNKDPDTHKSDGTINLVRPPFLDE